MELSCANFVVDIFSSLAVGSRSSNVLLLFMLWVELYALRSEL